eukprot:1177124-Prymnesium_polylepis.1
MHRTAVVSNRSQSSSSVLANLLFPLFLPNAATQAMLRLSIRAAWGSLAASARFERMRRAATAARVRRGDDALFTETFQRGPRRFTLARDGSL